MNWNDLYRILHEYYGDIQWWSPEDKLEVVVGSILGQNTTWTSVEKAIANLKDAKLEDFYNWFARRDITISKRFVCKTCCSLF